jgi:hypothetical protein
VVSLEWPHRAGIIGLVHLGQRAQAECFAHIPSLNKLSRMLSDTIRYLDLNADSMPDYGKRYRVGQRISTGFVESEVNEIVAKRMVKKQQMRWNRYTVQSILDVRIHVSMALWKMHSVSGTKASGRSRTKPTWLSQHVHTTALHTLVDLLRGVGPPGPRHTIPGSWRRDKRPCSERQLLALRESANPAQS